MQPAPGLLTHFCGELLTLVLVLVGVLVGRQLNGRKPK